jgi:hypothetical protein
MWALGTWILWRWETEGCFCKIQENRGFCWQANLKNFSSSIRFVRDIRFHGVILCSVSEANLPFKGQEHGLSFGQN